MKTTISAAIFAIVLSFAPQFVFGQAQDASVAEWTIMCYMDSDNNLENPQINLNINWMMETGSTDKVNIVLLVDRSPKGEPEKGYTNKGVGGIPGWTTAKYLYVEKGKLRDLGDWGEINMGDPANLVKFVTTAEKQFPAKKYGLLFGDHGAGWYGIVGDETSGGDNLNMAELYSALSAVTKSGKLELIGFDACLMGNLESARIVSPFAKYMVASEEIEPGVGWYYPNIVRGLTAKPEIDGAGLASGIVSAYKFLYTSPEAKEMGQAATLGAIDLSKIDTVVKATNDLSAVTDAFVKAGGRTALLKTAKARSMTEEYGKSGGKSEFFFFDLVHYAQNIKAQTGDPAVSKAADGVIASVAAAMLSKTNGPAMPHANGLSIWFPNKSSEIVDSGYATFFDSAQLKWGGFLTSFASRIGTDKEPPTIADVASTKTEVAANAVTTVTAKVNADDLDEATFVLAEHNGDETIIVGAIPAEPDEKGVLKEEWDGEWFSIGDGENETICPVTDFRELDDAEDAYWIEVPVQVRYKGEKLWRDMTLYFVVDFKEKEPVGKFVYAVDFANKQARQIDLELGDAVRPVYESINDKGESTLIAATDEADVLHIKKEDSLTVGRERVAPGNYLIGFAVTDLAGNANDKFVGVTIK